MNDSDSSRNLMKSPSSMKPATDRLACSRTITVRACWNRDERGLMSPAQLKRLAQRMRSVLL